MVAAVHAQSVPLPTSSSSLASHSILGKAPVVLGSCVQLGRFPCVPTKASVLFKASDHVLTSGKVLF